MATKKKTRKNLTKSKQAAPKKGTAKAKLKQKLSRKLAARKATPKKATIARKKKVAGKKTASKKKVGGKTVVAAKKKTLQKRTSEGSSAFLREPSRSSSGEQSGDLQGLSHRESADSESVDELLEEGNAFEAGVVQGVEEAGDEAEREVRTHEVSEDDVPEEYLDKE